MRQEKITPVVSVIIPTYNRAHIISRAIRSVLAQSFKDWELIIVDDGSSDNTEEIMKEFPDPRIRYLRHEKNRGVSAARNTGIREARGDYIAFLDSDDEWLPEKLQRQIEVFKSAESDVGLVYTGAFFIDGERGWQRVKRARRVTTQEEQLASNPIGGCSRVMVRRECFNKWGCFDESLSSYEDYDMWVRIAGEYKVGVVNELLVKYYEHSGGKSAKPESLISSFKIIWDKFRVNDRPRWIKASLYFRLGHRLCYIGAMSDGRRYLLKAVNTAPWQPKYWISLFLSLFGRRLYHDITFTILRFLG